MKQIILLISVAASCTQLNGQSIGIGTTTPNTSAILEIKSNDKGLLIPRTSTISRTAIVNPAKGLMVYDTTTSSFWFYTGSSWGQIETFNNNWSVNGNAGISAANNFIGTIDKRPLQFKINNQYAGVLDTLNNVIIGVNATPADKSFSSVAIGYGAFKTGNGGEMVAIGINTLSNNVNGIWNTAVGSYALAVHKTGNLNTAIGYAALDNDTSGSSNSALGAFALSGNKSGTNNNAFGNNTLRNNDSGSYNTAAGSGALFSNIGGHQNSAYGRRALYNNTNGFSNAAFGNWALHSNTTGSNLVAFGDSALLSNGIGASGPDEAKYNTATGSKALYNNTTGYGNTANGYLALSSVTTGYGNTSIGFQTMESNVTGNNNTAVGALANVVGNIVNATAIGAGATAGQSNTVQLGNGQVSTVRTAGNLFVQNTKGIIRSADATQQKKLVAIVTVSATIVAGGTANFAFSFPESFGGIPDVYVGNIIGGGGFAEVIMSVANISASGGSLFVNNPRTGSYSPNFSVKIIAIGPQ